MCFWMPPRFPSFSLPRTWGFYYFWIFSPAKCCGRYLKDEHQERLPDILANEMLRAEDFAKLDPGMVARILEKMEW